MKPIRPMGMPFDIVVKLPVALDQPVTGVEVTFEGPDGSSICMPAFRSGDGRMKARFAAATAGPHRWSAREQGSEKPFRTGVFDVAPVPEHDTRPALYREGRLRVASNRRTLEHANGKPFLWLGDTWWFGLTRRLDWPRGFRQLTADRVSKGFNVIQIVAGPLPDLDAVDNPFDIQQEGDGGPSWSDGWGGLNAAYFDAADRRIACLVEQGLVPCIVGMWGYFLPFMGIERVKQHWRELVARYAAYPVVWCIAGESNMVTYSIDSAERAKALREEQETGWTDVARYVRTLDPYRNPITVHPSRPDSKAMVRDVSVLDVDMLQTGHSGYDSLKPSVEMLKACSASEPRMPTLIGEVNYEGIMGGNREEVQRFLVWASLMDGACGFTYGAQGIWQMSARQDPHRGYTGCWGRGVWEDAMHYPGSCQVGLARRLFERYPWSRFTVRSEPKAEEQGRISTLACGIPGEVALFYLPVNCLSGPLAGLNGSWSGGLLEIAIEPGAKYRAWWYDPRTGDEIRTYVARSNRSVTMGLVIPRADGYWTPPPKPAMDDWVLVLER